MNYSTALRYADFGFRVVWVLGWIGIGAFILYALRNPTSDPTVSHVNYVLIASGTLLLFGLTGVFVLQVDPIFAQLFLPDWQARTIIRPIGKGEDLIKISRFVSGYLGKSRLPYNKMLTIAATDQRLCVKNTATLPCIGLLEVARTEIIAVSVVSVGVLFKRDALLVEYRTRNSTHTLTLLLDDPAEWVNVLS